LYPSTFVPGAGGRHPAGNPTRPPERNLALQESLRQAHLENYPSPDTLSNLGCNVSFRRQRRRSCSNRFNQSQFEHNLFRSDGHSNGYRDECRFDPCHRVERNFVQPPLQRRHNHRCTDFNHHLHGDRDEFERKREFPDNDNGERFGGWIGIESNRFDYS
jgi:hypothetical protein